MGSSNSSQALQDKTVVVIGGSFGGNTVAYSLRGKCKLVVIDTREAMHLSIAAPRAIVESEFVKRTLVPLKDIYGDSFRQGTVTNIDPSANQVTLASGEQIKFDYLVIATGSSVPFPGKFKDDVTTEQAVQMYRDANEKVKAAKRIVIIGGGAVGTEVAGEIATEYPDKEVTIVHSRDSLIEPATSQGFRAAVNKQLESLNVNLVLGEKVTNLDSIPRDLSGPVTVVTDKDKSIEADLAFVCIGLTVNSQLYGSSLASSVNERGYLQVNRFLQVVGYDNIFAVGDCNDADAQKMAFRAMKQGEVLQKNILLHADGKELKPYNPPSVVFAVSIGRHRGQIQIGSLVLGSWLAKRAKSKDLMSGKIWKEWGLTAPSPGRK